MTSKDIFRELGGLDADLVLSAAPAQDGRVIAPKKSFTLYKKLIAVAASFALIIGLCSVIGFDNVYASIQNIFSFIPGVGIENANDNVIYTYEAPAAKLTGENGMSAELLRASYSEDMLTLALSCSGKPLMGEDVKLLRNGIEVPHAHAMPFISSDCGIIELSFNITDASESDRFGITVSGFEGKIEFTLKPCADFAELSQIGPTETRNGISITATAQRFGNELVVWCYDTKGAGATRDRITGIGKPSFGSNSEWRYLMTESGKVLENYEGWQISDRMVYKLAEGETGAVLHIPYISLVRDEKAKLKLDLPATYGTSALDETIKTSLGEIKIISVERTEQADGTDRLMLRLDYVNASENTKISFADYEIKNDLGTAVHFNAEKGAAEYIEVITERGEDRLNISIDSINYYLTDAYEIELDID